MIFPNSQGTSITFDFLRNCNWYVSMSLDLNFCFYSPCNFFCFCWNIRFLKGRFWYLRWNRDNLRIPKCYFNIDKSFHSDPYVSLSAGFSSSTKVGIDFFQVVLDWTTINVVPTMTLDEPDRLEWVVIKNQIIFETRVSPNYCLFSSFEVSI